MRIRHNFPIIKTKRYDKFMTTIDMWLKVEEQNHIKHPNRFYCELHDVKKYLDHCLENRSI